MAPEWRPAHGKPRGRPASEAGGGLSPCVCPGSLLRCRDTGLTRASDQMFQDTLTPCAEPASAEQGRSLGRWPQDLSKAKYENSGPGGMGRHGTGGEQELCTCVSSASRCVPVCTCTTAGARSYAPVSRLSPGVHLCYSWHLRTQLPDMVTEPPDPSWPHPEPKLGGCLSPDLIFFFL